MAAPDGVIADESSATGFGALASSSSSSSTTKILMSKLTEYFASDMMRSSGSDGGESGAAGRGTEASRVCVGGGDGGIPISCCEGTVRPRNKKEQSAIKDPSETYWNSRLPRRSRALCLSRFLRMTGSSFCKVNGVSSAINNNKEIESQVIEDIL